MIIKKSLFAFAVAGLLLTACKQTDSAPETSAEATKENTTAASGKLETASFSIEGMSCSVGCAKTIEKKLAGLEGVQKAAVDYDNKTATVEYDSAVQSPEKLAEVVEASADGKTYKVTSVKSSADKAMFYGDPVKEKKKKKSKKAADQASETATPEAKPEGKPACCSAKKACSSGEKATL